MARPKLSEMTLREKIGQTGLPGPGEVRRGVQTHGGYRNYFTKYPFTGLHLDTTIITDSGNKFTSPTELAQTLADLSNNIRIPLLVSCDFEKGAKNMFDEFHQITSNMSVGAACSKELAYERGYLWAKELKSMGVNWPFGPVGDLLSNFFSTSGVRCLTDSPDIAVNLFPSMIQGVQAAGIAATAKHFPGGAVGNGDYRDSHFSSSCNKSTQEQWNHSMKPVWKSAVDAGVLSFMMGHPPFPAVDPSYTRGKVPRPSTASRKVTDLLRKDLNFNGVIVTDAVSMKNLTAAFEHDDMYIECFNAGNDIILFVHNDYIDVMEKAVLDGRISMEQLDASVERILDMKEKLGLFDGPITAADTLTEEEKKHFVDVNYQIAQKALTLISNTNNKIPFDSKKVKNVTIIAVTPHKPFLEDLKEMVAAFERRGIRANIIDGIKSKDYLKELAETEDIIIYACCLAQGFLKGMPFFATPENLLTLFDSLSYGAEKSVIASFDSPSVYYNYFEDADMYINAYSFDTGTMNAFVDGILGDFEFTGKSPVALKPEFKNF